MSSRRKKQYNDLLDIWIEKKSVNHFVVHALYDTDRTTEINYKANSFEDAQKIFASVSNQKLEDLINWDKEPEDKWSF